MIWKIETINTFQETIKDNEMTSVSIDVDPDTFLVFRSDFCSATSVRIFVRNVSNDKAAIFKVNLFARYMVYKIFTFWLYSSFKRAIQFLPFLSR